MLCPLGRFVPAAALMSAFVLVAGFAACTEDIVASCEDQGGILVVGEDGKERCEEPCSGCIENNVCVGNRCRLLCDSHNDCFSVAKGNPVTQACLQVDSDSKKGLNQGPKVSVCQESPKLAQIGLPCPSGTECDGLTACPDGSPCDAANCDAAQCRPLACRSRGPEDADAYCTTLDCQSDDQCGPGLYCTTRQTDGVCGTKGEGEPDVGDCAGLDAYNATNGTSYQEGPNWLLRNVCLKREGCAPCASNVDCSLADDMACVTIGTTSHCAKTCLADADCPNDNACAGAAAPTLGYCVPRTGSCTPPPSNNFCHPCLSDLDCGPAGPGNTVACVETSGNQHGCFDISFPDLCTVDSECPQAPSGLFGECLDEAEGLGPNDALYHHCYLPFRSDKFQCYPD